MLAVYARSKFAAEKIRSYGVRVGVGNRTRLSSSAFRASELYYRTLRCLSSPALKTLLSVALHKGEHTVAVDFAIMSLEEFFQLRCVFDDAEGMPL
jgi:hypothetical protein